MSYLENNNLKGFKKIIKSLHDVEQLSDLPQSIQENFKYIQKHSPSYFKALKLGLPGCSAEGHISHYLASHLTRHPKAYNPSIAYTTAALISMAHNGIPLTKFLNKMKFHYYQPCIETPNSASYHDIYKAQDRY